MAVFVARKYWLSIAVVGMLERHTGINFLLRK